MSKIKCNQKKCKYNHSEHCMLDCIEVDKAANCKSYKEGKQNSNYSFEFASFERLNNTIKCSATECIYNKSKNCIIENLNIGKHNNIAPCTDYKSNK